MKFHMKNSELLESLNEKVYGHLTAKKILINLLNRSLMRHHQKWIDRLHKDYLLPPQKVLLIGGSGTGKTHLVNCLKDLYDFPLIKVDATDLVPTGASESSGKITSQGLQLKILENAKSLCASTKGLHPYSSVLGTIDKTIVFIDEIDKLATNWDSGNWNTHVQSNFLTLFDTKDTDYAGVSYIFAGAFSGMKDEKLKSKSIGFGGQLTQESSKVSDKEVDKQIIKYGLITELVGRITGIAELDELTKEDYKNIIITRLLPEKRIELSYYGIYDFDIDDAELEILIDYAIESKQGIRAVKRKLDQKCVDAEFEYENIPSLEYNIKVDDDTGDVLKLER